MNKDFSAKRHLNLRPTLTFTCLITLADYSTTHLFLNLLSRDNKNINLWGHGED